MEEMRLKGDEAYFDALAAGRRKVLDNRTFKQPIRSIGMRACAILGENEIERGEVTIKHLGTRQQVVQAQAGAGDVVKRMLETKRG